MILMRTNGLQISGGNYPVNPGNSEVYIAEPVGQVPANNPNNSGAAQVGKMSLAVGIGEIMSQWNIPNAIDYVEGIYGSFTDDSRLVDKFDSEFRTLGNGKFELNDVLAFPVNWGVRLLDHLNLLPRPNKKETNSNENTDETSTSQNNPTNSNNKTGKGGSSNGNNNSKKGGTGHAR